MNNEFVSITLSDCAKFGLRKGMSNGSLTSKIKNASRWTRFLAIVLREGFLIFNCEFQYFVGYLFSG